MSTTEIAELKELQIPEEWKELIEQLLKNGTKVTPANVERVWEMAMNNMNHIEGLQSRILWIETGNNKAGLQHILDKHGKEFSEYTPIQLAELAEASTSIGLPMGHQNKTRPIFGLFFHGQPLAVAVQVGSNGFVVSMNKKSFDKMKTEVEKHGGSEKLKELLERSHSWPKV